MHSPCQIGKWGKANGIKYMINPIREVPRLACSLPDTRVRRRTGCWSCFADSYTPEMCGGLLISNFAVEKPTLTPAPGKWPRSTDH